VEEVVPPSLPPGGTRGQVLTKISDADGDADWLDPIPSGINSFVGNDAIAIHKTIVQSAENLIYTGRTAFVGDF
jgi:hypothetical protein